MKSSIVYAVILRTFVTFETMIWPSTELKKSLDIFSPRQERKRSEEKFTYPFGCKKKALSDIFLSGVHLEK